MTRHSTVKPSKGLTKVGKKTSARNTDTYSGRIGAVVRERREKLGLTVDAFVGALAQRDIEVQPPTIYHWESGRNPIPVNALPAIAAILKTPIRKLLPES